MELEDIAAQKEALVQYESQLKHITDLIETSDNESRKGLNSLKEKLIELIALTKESIASLEPDQQSTSNIDDEFALFMSEIQNDTTNNSSEHEKNTSVPTVPTFNETEEENNDDEEEEELNDEDGESNIWEELNGLVGTKCQAPYSEEWTNEISSYHNAMIMSIDSIDDVKTLKVKVMFINPTSRKMIPCSYFLDGECKFSDDQCHFSHGYIVNFSELKEYKEPDFDLLRENVSVLAKDSDNLWKHAIVTGLIPEENQCSIQFESGNKRMMVVDIKNTLPLSEAESESQEYSNPKSSDIGPNASITQEEHAALVDKSLTQQPQSERLGGWEKYTKSIGSKLMASMGYVVGTGLGKRGDGRLEPVAALVLPPGKSLDHCMKLREAAGGDPNLFKAEKYQKKLQNKIIARNVRRQKRADQLGGKPKNVFNFINDSLMGSSSKQTHYPSQTNKGTLKDSSAQQLNVEELKVSESIDKKRYELFVLKDTLTRQKKNTVGFNSVSKKLKQAQMELHSLQNKLNNVNKEQSYRKTMKELTKF